MSRDIGATISESIQAYGVKLDETIPGLETVIPRTEGQLVALMSAQNERTLIRAITNLTLPQIQREVRIWLLRTGLWKKSSMQSQKN